MNATLDEQNQNDLTTIDKLRGIRWAIASNTANTIFVQFTYFGSVFILFLNELGLSKTDIGFIMSFTPFAGLIALFIAPRVARFGFKRTFLTFYSIRKVITIGLLFTPAIYLRYGSQLTFFYIAAIVSTFSIARAVAEQGRFPWVQEYVPSTMQGKFSATNNIFSTIAGFLAVTIAGSVLEYFSGGLSGYMWLIAVGIGFGVLSVWLMSFVPGGAPIIHNEENERPKRDLGAALNDSNFKRYLLGAGLIVVATQPLTSFVPLYMREQIGLSAGSIVYLQSGTLIGSMLTSFVWGWASDRYGGRPVMLLGVILTITLPIFWLALPMFAGNKAYPAMAIAFLQGVAAMGWGIGSVRLLFVGMVPPDKKGDYMALYHAFIGFMGGISQLFGGRILDASQNISGSFMGVELNPFLPIFAIGLLLPLIALFLMARLQIDETLTMGQFLGIFYRGNPFLAVTSMIRNSFATDEESTIRITERLGRSRSMLTVEELLKALQDPRFNVRFEAIIATSRMDPEPHLIAALQQILNGNTPALSVVAAWALGRIGDESAIEPLRDGMHNQFRSIQAQSVRSLGTLGDRDSVEELRTLLATSRVEDQNADVGLHMAYASALGKMGDSESVPAMLQFLRKTEDKSIQLELALAIARIADDESYFIQLHRHYLDDPGTTLAQAIVTFNKQAPMFANCTPDYGQNSKECIDLFAHNRIHAGAKALAEMINNIRTRPIDPINDTILAECADHLATLGAKRPEYLILALQTMNAEIRK